MKITVTFVVVMASVAMGGGVTALWMAAAVASGLALGMLTGALLKAVAE